MVFLIFIPAAGFDQAGASSVGIGVLPRSDVPAQEMWVQLTRLAAQLCAIQWLVCLGQRLVSGTNHPGSSNSPALPEGNRRFALCTSLQKRSMLRTHIAGQRKRRYF
jgi:hypothetical protein